MGKSIKIDFTADDFGISPGVNRAILSAFMDGLLNSASIMANMDYFEEAVQLHREQAPDLRVGVHINISLGKPLLPDHRVYLLIDKQGNFRRDFIGYLCLPFIKNRKKLEEQVGAEIEEQIKKCIKSGLRIDHLDSHRYVHTIPWIYKIVSSLAKKYNIQHVRVMNESLWKTFLSKPTVNFLYNGNLIKHIVLKSFYRINRYKTEKYFFSILHSCRLDEKLINNLKYPKRYDRVEIVFHPGMPELDKEATSIPSKERKHLLSECRRNELDLLLKKPSLQIGKI